MNFDIKTVIFLSAIAAIVMGLNVLITAKTHPQINGITKWAWGCAVQSAAWLLIYFRGQIPDFFSIVSAYALLLISLTLFYQALSDFKEIHFPRKLFYTLNISAFFLFLFFTYVYPSYIVRIVTITVLGSSLSILCSYMLFFKGNRTSTIGERIMGLGFFLIGLSPVAMLFSIFSSQLQLYNIVPLIIVQNVIFVIVFISLLILTSSFLLMINDRFMEEILRLATMDSLTQVFNRAAMEKLIKMEIDRSNRYELPMSLLLIDVDYFKRVNDTYGHQIGDLTLKSLVSTIKKALREHDVLGRFGGEEFTVLLPDTNFIDAKIVAERIRETVEKNTVRVGSKTFNQTISIGFSTLDLKNDDFEKIFRRADLGLYNAKQNGRNMVAAFDDENNEILFSSEQNPSIYKPKSKQEAPPQINSDFRDFNEK